MMAVTVKMNVARRSRTRDACTGKFVGSNREKAMMAENIVNGWPKYRMRGCHTQAKGEHIWQRTRSIVDNVELTGLQQDKPDDCTATESFASTSREIQE